VRFVVGVTGYPGAVGHDLGCGPGNSTEVLAAVALAYPAMADGSVLLPFPRLFMTAMR
jgi:trans-aconitate methyltransferase